MSYPLTLRLCCLAAMAPALTEAATQARVKLPSGSTKEGSQTGKQLLNSGGGVATTSAPANEKTTQSNSSGKDVTPSIIGVTNLGQLPLRVQRRVGFIEPVQESGGMTDRPLQQKMPRGGGLPIATLTKQHLAMGYPQRAPQKTPTILFPVLSSSVNKQPKMNHMTVASSSSLGRPADAGGVQQDVYVMDPNKRRTDSVFPEVGTMSNAELMTETKRRQRDLERKSDRLLRRMRHLQSRQAIGHVQNQLKGLVEHQHHNLQSMAKSMKAQPESVDLKAELLHNEDVKSLSTAALVTLVRRLQSQQALGLRQRLSGATVATEPEPSILKLDEDLCAEMNRVSGTLQMNLNHLEHVVDSDATESSSGGESCDEDYDLEEERLPKPPLRRRAEWRWAMDRAAVAARWTWLQAQVSDLEYRIRQQSDIFKQIRAGKGAVSLGDPPPPGLDLLGVKSTAPRTGKKLTPYEEKIAILERKNTEMSPCNLSTLLSNVDKQSSRLTQQLGNVYSPQGSPMLNNASSTPVPSKGSTPNGFVDHANGQHSYSATDENSSLSSGKGNKLEFSSHFDPPSPTVDTTCVAARCRPVRSYGKRKLLRTSGLCQLNRKAARLSTVRCNCCPPNTPCAMCGGRYNNTQTLDPVTMPHSERIALLDPTFHPVLSFDHDIPISVHFEALLKSGDWQHKPPPKPVKPMTAAEKRRARITDRPVRKYTRRLNKTAAMVSSAKIKNKYEQKQITRNHQAPGIAPEAPPSRDDLRQRMKKRKAAVSAMDSLKKRRLGSSGSISSHRDSTEGLSHSMSSNSLKEQMMRRRRGESAFDINNIVIPYSMAASTRVEKLQYKEIITPRWREVGADLVKVELENDGPVEKDIKEVATVKQEVEETPAIKDSPKTDVKPLLKEPRLEEDDEEEDLTDETYSVRHARCEVAKKKKVPTATLR